MIASLPTVVGGVSSDEFLASVEVLDNSARLNTLCKKSNRRLKKIKLIRLKCPLKGSVTVGIFDFF